MGYLRPLPPTRVRFHPRGGAYAGAGRPYAPRVAQCSGFSSTALRWPNVSMDQRPW